MGMYDTIYSRIALPDCDLPPEADYQTKDLDCFLEHYLIDTDGRLLRCRSIAEDPLDPSGAEDTHYHGDLRFGTTEPGDRFYEFVARFTDGRLVWVRRDHEAEQAWQAWVRKHRS
jgi:hypothetical protein